MGVVRGVVMDHLVVMPVEPPVVPPPGEAAEDGDTESEAEIEVGPVPENAGNADPAGIDPRGSPYTTQGL
jgi:hypothetical protein